MLEREGLLERARAMEQPLLDGLCGLGDHPLVSEVRGGVGLQVFGDDGVILPIPAIAITI